MEIRRGLGLGILIFCVSKSRDLALPNETLFRNDIPTIPNKFENPS